MGDEVQKSNLEIYIAKYNELYQQLQLARIDTQLLDDLIFLVKEVQWERFKESLLNMN